MGVNEVHTYILHEKPERVEGVYGMKGNSKNSKRRD